MFPLIFRYIEIRYVQYIQFYLFKNRFSIAWQLYTYKLPLNLRKGTNTDSKNWSNECAK